MTTAVVVGAVYLTKRVMKWAKRQTIGGGTQLELDSESGAEAADIQRAIRAYLHARGIGTRARSVSNQVKAVEEKHAHMTSVIKAKFPEQSLSNVKFQSAVDTARDVIMRNCTILANRFNAFDVRDFQVLDRANSAQILRRSKAANDIQAQRWRLLSEALESMDVIIDANERMLLQLDKLSAELALVGLEQSEVDTNDMLSEIQTLTEQAKLYR